MTNKKGFILHELLIGIAISAIGLPLLIQYLIMTQSHIQLIHTKIITQTEWHHIRSVLTKDYNELKFQTFTPNKITITTTNDTQIQYGIKTNKLYRKINNGTKSYLHQFLKIQKVETSKNHNNTTIELHTTQKTKTFTLYSPKTQPTFNPPTP